MRLKIVMTEKITGIVINVIKHSDRHNVVTLFTRTRGRLSFLSPALPKGRNRGRNARLSLLSVVECDVRLKANSPLQTLPAITNPYVWRTIYFNPVKTALTLFLGEFLNKLLRTSAPDEELWDYIINSLLILDSLTDRVANFHLSFLVGLSYHVGIFPLAETYHEGYYFDMRAGQFVPFRPSHPDYLSENESSQLIQLMRINYANMHRFAFSGEQRSHILGRLLHYYSIHLPGTSGLSSPAILSQLFN